MMKPFIKIAFIVSLIISSCQSKQINNENAVTKALQIESSPLNLVEYELPILKREVNDFELIFTDTQVENLTVIIKKFESRTSNQIVIVSIDSLGSYTSLSDFSTDLSNHNGIGLKGKNNGFAIVFSKKRKEIRISTGLSTQKILTDDVCKNIIDHIIIPEFKKEEYFNGIEKGLITLIAEWE